MADHGKRDEQISSTSMWSWGAGTHGQLASGDFTDAWEPLHLTEFDMEISNSIDDTCCPRVLDMAGGGSHAVAVLGTKGHGQVVTWGNGQSGALGHGNESDISIPKAVNFFQGIQIRSVAAGWSHTAFVSNSGELYTCGNGSFGQLGHGNLEACLIPSKVKNLPCKAVSIAACGMRHTLVLARGASEGQEVYGFGLSKRGQLGIGTLGSLKTRQHSWKNTGKVSVPQRILGLPEQQIVLLAANGDHSAALSETGGLYLWGRGFDSASDTFIPSLVGSQLKFSNVALGWNHCIAIADGHLWAWGSNHLGQLGTWKGLESTMSPVIISKDSDVINTQIMMGDTLGEPTAADAHICTENLQERIAPKSISCLSCCSRVEMHPSAAVSEEYRVGTGTGSCACTSKKNSPDMIRVCGLEGKVVRWLSAGSEHSAIVLDDGKIMVWGWGEHGQLGLGTDHNQPYPKYVSIPSIELEGQLRWRTFCGSGFTFAVAEPTNLSEIIPDQKH